MITQEQIKWNEDKLFRLLKYISPTSTFIVTGIFILIWIRNEVHELYPLSFYLLIILWFISPVMCYWITSIIDKIKSNHYSVILRNFNIDNIINNLEKELVDNKIIFNKKENIKEGFIKFRYYYEIYNNSLHIRIIEIEHHNLKGERIIDIEISIGKYSDTNIMKVEHLKKMTEVALQKSGYAPNKYPDLH